MTKLMRGDLTGELQNREFIASAAIGRWPVQQEGLACAVEILPADLV
jgi:hypothetical protein